MTRGRWLEAITIVGLAVVSIGLGWNTIASGSRPRDAGDPHRLEVSSIDLTTGSRDATFSAQGMAPGDAYTTAITVANPGREAMTYTMSHDPVSTGGALLSAALLITIKTVGSSCADDDGTILYDGPLDAAAFGSQGNGRPLAAATAEILCFRAALPLDAGNELQGAATTVTLSFGASLQSAVR
jgi:hypothetical protein